MGIELAKDATGNSTGQQLARLVKIAKSGKIWQDRQRVKSTGKFDHVAEQLTTRQRSTTIKFDGTI